MGDRTLHYIRQRTEGLVRSVLHVLEVMRFHLSVVIQFVLRVVYLLGNVQRLIVKSFLVIVNRGMGK